MLFFQIFDVLIVFDVEQDVVLHNLDMSKVKSNERSDSNILLLKNKNKRLLLLYQYK
jgi:hypothetical protein